MDNAYNRHSRRSTSNIAHLSLAPLTSKFPIGDEEELPLSTAHRVSYIEGRSAPSTPGILSRSPSSTRLRFQLSNNNAIDPEVLPKSKSTTHLRRIKSNRSAGNIPLASSSEWLLRAGQTISSEARESKGQSWLVSRASSTSLVDRGDEEPEAAGWAADDEFSRAQSRVNSRYTSRRGSKQGSREGLAPGSRPLKGGYFDDETGMLATEADFVDEAEIERRYLEEVLDDVEIERLTRTRGFGLGRWVDRLAGWSMFAVDEDDGEVGDEADENTAPGESRRKPRADQERVIVAERPPPAPEDKDLGDQGLGEGGWNDAAWLLSVASKVIL